MKILLVLPPSRTYVIQPNLGLGYLASCLRRNGHYVQVLDSPKEKFRPALFETFLKRNPFDAIGFHMFSQHYGVVREMSRAAKKALPGSLVLLGGPHPSGDPWGTVDDFPDADFVLAGEAEHSLVRLLDLLEARALRDNWVLLEGVYGKGKPRGQETGSIVDDLDTLPFPAWDLMRPDQYPEAPHGAFLRRYPYAPMILSRGCVHRCKFCAGAGRKFRVRSLENIRDEMQWLEKDFGIREFLFEDENLTYDRDFLHRFCEMLLSRKDLCTWSCPSGVRLSHLHLEDVELMERSGCHSISVGIESGSQRVLDSICKGLSVNTIREKVGMLTKTGMRITGFYLIGLPDESITEMEETIDLALSLPLHRVQINNFMPLPGSSLWRQMKDSGSLGELDYNKFFVHDVAFSSDPGKKRAIKALQRKGYLLFYLRWKILGRLWRDIRSASHFFYLMRRFADAMT